MSSPSKDCFMRPMEYRPDVVPVKTRRQVLLDQLGLAGEKLFQECNHQLLIVIGLAWPHCNLFVITGQVKCGSKGFHPPCCDQRSQLDVLLYPLRWRHQTTDKFIFRQWQWRYDMVVCIPKYECRNSFAPIGWTYKMVESGYELRFGLGSIAKHNALNRLRLNCYSTVFI